MDSSSKSLDRIFAALSDSTRRSIITQLQHGESTVMELAAQYEMSFQAVSKHLKYLESAALIQRKRRGRYQVCTLEQASLTEAMTWIVAHNQLWNDSFDTLQQLLEAKKDEE